jgi:hypothetical protein
MIQRGESKKAVGKEQAIFNKERIFDLEKENFYLKEKELVNDLKDSFK